MNLCAGAWAQIFFIGILFPHHNESLLSTQLNALRAAQAVIVDPPMQNGAMTSDGGFWPLLDPEVHLDAVFSKKLLYMPIRHGERPGISRVVHQNPPKYSNY
jgi:hypothetical protein